MYYYNFLNFFANWIIGQLNQLSPISLSTEEIEINSTPHITVDIIVIICVLLQIFIFFTNWIIDQLNQLSAISRPRKGLEVKSTSHIKEGLASRLLRQSIFSSKNG